MNKRIFDLVRRAGAVAVLLISAVVYLMTIEPTASFWDCGEFIASSYKLEVGHPPGNPVFQLFARIFTLFADAEHAAVAVNALSAICSAFTIFFLYLTIVFLAKRLVKPRADGSYGAGTAIALIGSGLVGSLAYCFTDTFWFSAVEGEVYAMSSLFTAMVFWAMTKWYEQADEPHANRWIVLISLLIGLSIGVHLLNLLTIPALVFLYFYRKREDRSYTAGQYVLIFVISCLILALILFVIIPYLPKIAAYVDLFFVNMLGLPFNTGAAFFMILLLTLCFVGLFWTLKHKKVVWNTVLLCFTMITIGFSLFTIVVIRSSAKTPTNEYQPDNPFTLVRYLSREQYGSTPLIYGQYFDARYDLEQGTYWAPYGDRYIRTASPLTVKYKASDKMLFPRMWSNASNSYIDFYEDYMVDGGLLRSGQRHRKPTFMENMSFFVDYQMNWMYWRYFMWNFAGRQNDVHSPRPGNVQFGNWECGIPFIDNPRLGNQENQPSYLAENKGKNHYYLLPLLLGLIGIFYQFSKDKRGSWVTFLLFFMTGIAIVVYLNQPPLQVRERDYAYAGSFYAFSIWIGLAVVGLHEWISGKFSSEKARTATASAVSLLCLGVPVLMARQNWDDHDRSHRYTAVEMATNYLNSVGKNGILITHGDNDTFPLWYAQEVEGIRTDVRICNTSLLGTDWHIDQMRYASNESAPLDIRIDPKMYLYGTNDWVYFYAPDLPAGFDAEASIDYIPELSQVLEDFSDPDNRLQLSAGEEVPYLNSRVYKIPVNKENVIKYGILDKKFEDQIPDYIVLQAPSNAQAISKPELFMLDLLSHYNWDRPLSLLSKGGDLNIGIKDYLMYDGFSYRFVPIKNKGLVDVDDLYDKVMNVYTWDALSDPRYYVDYHHLYTFCGVLPQRGIFVHTASELYNAGKKLQMRKENKGKIAVSDMEEVLSYMDKALAVMEKGERSVPESQYPLDMTALNFWNESYVMSMIDFYYLLSDTYREFSQMIQDEAWKSELEQKVEKTKRLGDSLAERFCKVYAETVSYASTQWSAADGYLVDCQATAVEKASGKRRNFNPEAYMDKLLQFAEDPKQYSRLKDYELEFLSAFIHAQDAYGEYHDKREKYIEVVRTVRTYGNEELADRLADRISGLAGLPDQPDKNAEG